MKGRVLIEQAEDCVFVAQVPVLPGFISQGMNRGEALSNVQEAVEAYLESLLAHDEPIPPPVKEEGGRCSDSRKPRRIAAVGKVERRAL